MASSSRTSHHRGAKDKTYAKKVEKEINKSVHSHSNRRRIIKASYPAPPLATSPVVSTIEQQHTTTPALKRTRAKKRTAKNIETTIPPPSSTNTINTTNSEVCTTPTPQLLAATPTTTSTIENTPHSNHTANDEDASPRPSKRRCTPSSTFWNGLYMVRDMLVTIFGRLVSLATVRVAAPTDEEDTNFGMGGGMDTGWAEGDVSNDIDSSDEDVDHGPTTNTDTQHLPRTRSQASKAYYDAANATRDVDHGLVLGQELQRAQHGNTLVQLLKMALGLWPDTSIANYVWLEKGDGQNHEDPNNILCFSHANQVAKQCMYGSKVNNPYSQLLTAVENFQSKDEKASWGASTGVEVLPYKRIKSRGDVDLYDDSMVFKIRCRFFYTGGLTQIGQLVQSRARKRDLVPKKKNRPGWEGLGYNASDEKICNVEGCNRSAKRSDQGRRGMCGYHYWQWYRSKKK